MLKSIQVGMLSLLLGCPLAWAASESPPVTDDEQTAPFQEQASLPALTPELINAAASKGVDANKLIATLIAAELAKTTLENQVNFNSESPPKLGSPAEIYQKLFSTVYYNLAHHPAQ